MSDEAPNPQEDQGAPDPLRPVKVAGVLVRYRSYVLVLLTLIYVVNYVDRQILSILLQPVKVALDLSDTQLGFLTGIAFALFYATLGIPLAMLADRTNRKTVIAWSLGLFSVMTAICAMVGNFWQLALARVFVGVGEAGTSPPSHSIIADLYPPRERATAMAIFATGLNIGILIGFLIGGWVNEWFGWRAAFLVAGLPGFILALVIRFFFREPPRGHADGMSATGEAPALFAVLKALWKMKTFRHLSFAAALNSFVGYGAVAWIPAFLIRSHDMSTGAIGTSLALIIGVAGGAGTFLGGYLVDKLSKGDPRWSVWVPAAALAIATPFSFIFYLSPVLPLALAAFVIPAVVSAIYLGPALALTQGLVSLRMRAVASAVLLFVINIIGLGLGPQMVGIASDLLNNRFGDDSLRWALIVTGLVNLWAVIHFLMAARTVRADLAMAEEARAAS